MKAVLKSAMGMSREAYFQNQVGAKGFSPEIPSPSTNLSSAPVVFLFDGDNQRKCDLGVNAEADSRVHHQEIPCSRFC